MSAGPRQGGFSLIELAVVLVIIGLLIGGGIAALDATTEQTRRSDQRRQLEHVREALYGFAMSRGRLPCPDDMADATAPDPDGSEDRSGTPPACTTDSGALPWVTLGLARRDAWGAPLLYHVEPAFADDPAAGADASFGLGTAATVTVRNGAGAVIVDNTPALVVSVGPQGGQVWTAGGLACPGAAQGFSSDETENCDGDDTYVDAGYRTTEDTDGRFDDLLIWLPDPVLKARMVQAGRLP